jgi:hypothetical protein
MTFYFPLTLGQRRRKYTGPVTPSRGRNPHPNGFNWREERNRLEIEFEELIESQILENIRWASPSQLRRFWVVLGEPGAGKSKLFDSWFARAVPAQSDVRLGARVPALVRLRELGSEEFDGNIEEVASRLWTHAIRCSAVLPVARQDVYSTHCDSLFTPIWLLDGLDEVAADVHGERLYQQIAALPGVKVVTCRTAVYSRFRREAEQYVQSEYEVLGLNPSQQEEFLAAILGGGRARELMQAIVGSAAIAQLASSPLILTLIGEQPEYVKIPQTRAAFYREAVREMWSRKITSKDGQDLNVQRDEVLLRLAHSMGLRVESLECDLSKLTEVCKDVAANQARTLQACFERSGLLRVDHRREVFSFVHLTFQEYFFSNALVGGGLKNALVLYWLDARYDEVLSLLISQLFERNEIADIELGIQWLINCDPEKEAGADGGYHIRRSPLRVCLHLLQRAAISLEKMDSVTRLLRGRIKGSRQRKLCVASDPNTPSVILAQLASDSDHEVKRAVASNWSTPSDTLAALAESTMKREVREAARANPQLQGNKYYRDFVEDTTAAQQRPPQYSAEISDISKEELSRLDTIARARLASDRNAPTALLNLLASDEIDWIRICVARNSNTPADSLRVLGRDKNADVKFEIAANPASPRDLLAEIAQEPNARLRRAIATNSSAPPSVLAQLVADTDAFVRLEASCNASTPAEVLVDLMSRSKVVIAYTEGANQNEEDKHPDHVGVRLRKAIVGNHSTPSWLLERFARETNSEVLRALASNPACPPSVLHALSSNDSPELRCLVAQSLNSPPDVLAALSNDSEISVRRDVALNPVTAMRTLKKLSKDNSSVVRFAVAQNQTAVLEEI